MKNLLLVLFLGLSANANIETLQSFQADFIQNIVDDHNKSITYRGYVEAKKPQYALWRYKSPVEKEVYILPHRVVIVEPDLEQAISKRIGENFDFFSLIRNAQKIDKNHYLAHLQEKSYLLTIENNLLESIRYKDDFDNNVTIDFTNIVINKKIDDETFIPKVPQDYDFVEE